MTTSTWIQVGFAAAILAVLWACRDTSMRGAPEREGPLEVEALHSGAYSTIGVERVAIARDMESWKALWAQIAETQVPSPPAPKVDFDDEMVVAVFLGSRPTAGYAVEIESCVASDGELSVTARETRPDPDSFQAAVVTMPYAVARVPRASGEARLSVETADR